MKRANQRSLQGYPDFRIPGGSNIDLSEDEPKKKQGLRGMSEAVIEGKGDKDDGEISLPMDINENSQSFLSEQPQPTDIEKTMDVDVIDSKKMQELDSEG